MEMPYPANIVSSASSAGGFPWSALIDFGSQLLGDWWSAKGQEDANLRALAEGDKNRAFQLYMSNTAHQREVADLRAAGLNPILSVNKGADMGSGAMPTLYNPNAAFGNLRSDFMNSARTLSDIRMNRVLADTELAKQQFTREQAREAKANADVASKTVNARVAEAKAKATANAVHSAKSIVESEYNRSWVGRLGTKVSRFFEDFLPFKHLFGGK